MYMIWFIRQKIPMHSSGIDLTKILEEKNIDEIEMMEIAENFFISLGFPATA